MARGILAGGPLHGKRLDEAAGEHLGVVASVPVHSLWSRIPPRPRWWRDPLGWLHWVPPERAPVPESVFVQHLYRANGQLRDGTLVLWWCGRYDGEPPADPDTALHLLMAESARVPPWDRQRAHWEMSMEWFTAIRRAAGIYGLDDGPNPGDVLLGAEVRVTVGSPRLVTEETP
jgi:hypothetical protein